MRNCNLKTLIKDGTRFGRLSVVKLTNKRNNSGNRIYELKCDCGNICEKTTSDLKKSKDPIKHCSIGCPLIDRKNKKKKHGKSGTVEYHMWKGSQNRAKANNIPFNLDHTDIIVPEICPILEIPIFKGTKKHTPNSPTLDRLIPELGYVKGNVRVISYKANIMKSDATIEEIKIFAKNVVKYLQDGIDMARTRVV